MQMTLLKEALSSILIERVLLAWIHPQCFSSPWQVRTRLQMLQHNNSLEVFFKAFWMVHGALRSVFGWKAWDRRVLKCQECQSSFLTEQEKSSKFLPFFFSKSVSLKGLRIPGYFERGSRAVFLKHVDITIAMTSLSADYNREAFRPRQSLNFCPSWLHHRSVSTYIYKIHL